MGHLSLIDVRGKIAHHRHFQLQAVIDFRKRMKVAADHLSARLQQGVHDLHKLVDIMEIMQDPAFHEHHVKCSAVFLQIGFQHVAHFIADAGMRRLRRLHGVPPVVLGNIKHRNLSAEQCQRNGFLSAGAADVGDLHALVPVKVLRVAPQHLFRIRNVLFSAFSRRAGCHHPEIVGAVLPGLFVLLAVVPHIFSSSLPLIPSSMSEISARPCSPKLNSCFSRMKSV